MQGRTIVDDDLDALVGGHSGLDGTSEPDKLLMPVPLHVDLSPSCGGC